MRGILINPYEEAVTAVEVDEDNIAKSIDCEWFTIVHYDMFNDLFVDDEGLMTMNDETRFFLIGSYPQPLAGKGLLLGRDGENTIGTDLDVDAVFEAVHFIPADKMKAVYLNDEV